MIAFVSALLLAVQAEAAAPPPPPAEAPPAEDSLVIEVEGQQGKPRIFFAPSGEPFRAYGNDPDPMLTWFRQADTNSDGKLGFEEFEADFLSFVDELDRDGNGEIGLAERTYYETEIAPETHTGTWTGGIEGEPRRVSRADTDPGASGSGSLIDRAPSRAKRYREVTVGAGRYDLLGLPQPVAAMDIRVRGRISQQDAQDSAILRFSLLDRDELGYLTYEGLPEPGG
jgi:hypothetical protein